MAQQPETPAVAAEHYEGPRTFATTLRESVPIPPGVPQRMLALEAPFHPTLSDLRAALGLDFDTADVFRAAREAGTRLDAVPADDELARLVDAMWRAVTSTRLVRARVDAGGIEVSRAHEPVCVREGEPLSLLVLADNTTGDDVELTARVRDGRGGVQVRAGRTASFLIDAGPLPVGSYLLPVELAAAGRAASCDVPIEAVASGTLSVQIVDDADGRPVAARVYLSDATGVAAPPGVYVRRDRHGNAFFHADGAFEARAGARTRVVVARGMEYEPAEVEVDVAPDERLEATVRMRRWSHMAERGWRSGDVHCHMHYGGEFLLMPEDVALVQRAEDVHFLNMMVANQGSGWVHDRDRFTGADHELSEGDHILRWGEEYRNDFYGHLCMYGITALVPPIYSGFALSEHPHNWPANAEAAKHCHTVGGTVSYAHPMFQSIELDRVFANVRTVEAKELPVDAALGTIDAVDVMSYPGNELETSKLWYRLLNCGLRLAATAGTDTFMNNADDGQFSNPPAGDRVFVRIDGEFTTESWCAGVRAGRTFVTDGPMLEVTVGGREIGDVIEARAGDVLRVEASATSYAPMERLELIVNGEIVAHAAATDGGRVAHLAHDITVEASCWVAVRALGPSHLAVLDTAVFAHTSPVYVTVGGAPVGVRDDAAYFIEWIDRLIAMAERTNRYQKDADRDAVVALFREGQAYYRRIVG